LFAIDLPAVLVLWVFRPKNILDIFTFLWIYMHKGFRSKGQFLSVSPSLLKVRLLVLSSLAILLVITSSWVLAVNEPARMTESYVVLEPETWVGKELPIIDHIDIGEQLKIGNWLIMLYHHDCPDCIATIPKIEQMAKDLQDNEEVLKFALIEIPPMVLLELFLLALVRPVFLVGLIPARNGL
jgi:thiol-disulfide isomerase/thioredoxin